MPTVDYFHMLCYFNYLSSLNRSTNMPTEENFATCTECGKGEALSLFIVA
jgi:hypothetical protein